MTQSNGNNPLARTMRRFVLELREEQPPPLDWERVEEKLEQAIAREQRVRPRQPWSQHPLVHAVGYAAVAASIALLLLASGSWQGASSPRIVTVVDPSTLPRVDRADDDAAHTATYRITPELAGKVVESGATPITLAMEGVAQWTLEPHSRVLVRTVGMPHELELERGGIHAQVVPRGPDEMVESFAVRAGDTRVAVHGTVFSVRLEADRLAVQVSHGTVAVGPAGHQGLTTGHMLVAPAGGLFSLDGARQAQLLPFEQPISHPVATLPSPIAAQPSRAAGTPVANRAGDPQSPGHVPQLPTTPRVGPQEAAAAEEPAGAAESAEPATLEPAEPAGPPEIPLLTVTQAQAMVDSCLRANGPSSSSGVRVTISATVTVKLNTDGQVTTVRFTPPLEPSDQQCASVLFGHRISYASSTVQFHVEASRYR